MRIGEDCAFHLLLNMPSFLVFPKGSTFYRAPCAVSLNHSSNSAWASFLFRTICSTNSPKSDNKAISRFRSCLSVAFLLWCGGGIARRLAEVYGPSLIGYFTSVFILLLPPSPAGLLSDQRKLFGTRCVLCSWPHSQKFRIPQSLSLALTHVQEMTLGSLFPKSSFYENYIIGMANVGMKKTSRS